MTLADKFNALAFSRWINSPSGRAFRLAAGSAFAVAGFHKRDTAAGKAALLWSFFPLTAGGLDLCWVSAALGGPLRGDEVRASGAKARLAGSVGRVPRGLGTSPHPTALLH
jgi:hypothetical protein